MSIGIPRGQQDEIIAQIVKALEPYEADHPHAKIDLYRQNSVSIRVRIVDPDLGGKRKPERHEIAWRYLDKLPEETQSEISLLLLLTPDEVTTSFANFEFDDPIPSRL
jgi:hypothetical protein